MFCKLFFLTVILTNDEYNDKVFAQLLPNASEGFERIIESWFPENAEFNESCVFEGCPTLNNFSLCPNDFNITVLHSVLKTATDCMRKPICGITIDNRPTAAVNASTEHLLPGFEIDGMIATLPGTGFLSNVSNIEFAILHRSNQNNRFPIQITVFITNIQSFGYFKFDLSLRSMLPSIAGQALTVTIPRAKYHIEAEYISTMSINQSLTNHNYDIRWQNPIIKVHPVFCGLDLPDGFPSVLTMLTTMAQIVTEKSSWAVSKALFLEKYFQSAFRIASNDC